MFSFKNVLEVACLAFKYSVAVFGAMHCSSLFVLWLLFTPMFPVAFIYLTWTFVFNWSAPRRGGREFGSHFMRRLPLFRYISDYFPISLVKTSELDPGKNYIFGYHPHSLTAEGAFYSFATEALGFSEKFPGIIPHVAIHSRKYTLGFLDAQSRRSPGGKEETASSLTLSIYLKGSFHLLRLRDYAAKLIIR